MTHSVIPRGIFKSWQTVDFNQNLTTEAEYPDTGRRKG
ncbi:hypothetical protein THTE_4362 [Thermogutta terrifontis]|uniref:Uncharacterized protein n=1 Tax=Thermogutta terrifontis TaxID=1331910 RepID=A0A286RLW6_9BACT|nr:hypothetical protein THTE_4362 [Thermogutta terrifontis]